MSKSTITPSYLNERINFGEQNIYCEQYHFILANKSSFSKYKEPSRDIIRFTFDCDDEVYKEFEEPFIYDFLTSILMTQEVKAHIVDGCLDYMPYVDAYFESQLLMCGNIRVSIMPDNGKLIDSVRKIVDDYNNLLSSQKKKSYGGKNGRVNDGKIG